MRVIDLSQPLSPAVAPWPGQLAMRVEVTGTYERTGCYFRRLELDEHYGTHFDAPSHFAPGGVHVDAIPADRLVVPVRMIDVRHRCAGDPDYLVEEEAVIDHERSHGAIGSHEAVLFATGWEEHRGDPDTYVSALRFPGLSVEAARALVDRRVVGIGIDTMSMDAGCNIPAAPVHHIVMPAGIWQLEGLVNLLAVPPTGATVVVGALPLVEGSGTPARVFALV